MPSFFNKHRVFFFMIWYTERPKVWLYKKCLLFFNRIHQTKWQKNGKVWSKMMVNDDLGVPIFYCCKHHIQQNIVLGQNVLIIQKRFYHYYFSFSGEKKIKCNFWLTSVITFFLIYQLLRYSGIYYVGISCIVEFSYYYFYRSSCKIKEIVFD